MRKLAVFWLLFLAITLHGPEAGAQAETYPSRNIRLFVPFAPAGVMDIVGRIVFERAGAILRQTVVVENRPGVGGTLARLWRQAGHNVRAGGRDAVAEVAAHGEVSIRPGTSRHSPE